MRNKISRYEENQVDRFLYDLYLLWGGNLDEDMCIGEGWIVYLEGTMIGLGDDKITQCRETLAYFPGNNMYRYREFVEDFSHKYIVQEQEIRKSIGEDELWLPW